MTFHFVRTPGPGARITVHAAQPDPRPIKPDLFGNFFEPLGFSIQGGVLAQLLLNPTMANQHNLPGFEHKALLENGKIAQKLWRLSEAERQEYANWRPLVRATGFGLMVLDDETENGIPLPWKLVQGAGRGNQPGRIGHSVVLNLRKGPAVLAQGIFAPHHRALSYEGHLWVKALGAGTTLRVEFRRRETGEVLSATALPWPGERWTKVPFTLALPSGSLAPLEPVDFAIAAEGEDRVWVDRALLLPADHVDGFDPDVLEMARRLAPPLLRLGGNYISGYRFQSGVGPLDLRQTVPDLAWGGIDDNFLGVDEFLRLCELLQTEPHLCVNMGDGTPEEAAALVQYVNGPANSYWGSKRAENGRTEPYGVRHWEIGNEIYGPWQIGHCGAEENARRYRLWSEAMKQADPTIRLMATGSCFDFVEPEHHWHEILLEDGGEHLECIALHCLPNNQQRFRPEHPVDHVWHGIMAQTIRWEQDIADLLEMCRRMRPGQPIDIAVTEWGPLGTTDRPEIRNMGGAVYAGLFLNMSIRTQENIRLNNATALMHGGSIVKAGPFLYTDPQVEVIRRYTELTGGHALPVTCEGPGYDVTDGARTAPQVPDVPYLDVVSVLRTDGLCDTVVVNRHPNDAMEVVLTIEGLTEGALLGAESMGGKGLTAMNTPVEPDRLAPQPAGIELLGPTKYRLRVEPHSVTWIKVRA